MPPTPENKYKNIVPDLFEAKIIIKVKMTLEEKHLSEGLPDFVTLQKRQYNCHWILIIGRHLTSAPQPPISTSDFLATCLLSILDAVLSILFFLESEKSDKASYPHY